MDWLNRMNLVMAYIESHLTKDIVYEEIARLACSSPYHFQRMFSFITDVTLGEYIRRRRLTMAAFDLQTSDAKVIDIALQYGYESPEAFSRAFKNMHGVMPMAARGKGVALKAYPKMSFQLSIKGDVEMNYRIEQKDRFEMAGIAVVMSTKDNKQFEEIPALWQRIAVDGEMQKLRAAFDLDEKDRLHAALYDFTDTSMTYMICVQANGKAIPKTYQTLSVEPQTWVIFPSECCDTPEQMASTIQHVWKRIFSEWFPTSGYEHACAPEFEMYLQNAKGQEYAEVWIPVTKKQ